MRRCCCFCLLFLLFYDGRSNRIFYIILKYWPVFFFLFLKEFFESFSVFSISKRVYAIIKWQKNNNFDFTYMRIVNKRHTKDRAKQATREKKNTSETPFLSVLLIFILFCILTKNYKFELFIIRYLDLTFASEFDGVLCVCCFLYCLFHGWTLLSQIFDSLCGFFSLSFDCIDSRTYSNG